MKQQFVIAQEDKGKRLDRFLTEHLEYSRSQIQKMIKEKHLVVTVNDRPTTAHHFLKVGDMVRVTLAKREEHPEIRQVKEIKLETLYEDDDILVINKPAGMAVHPAPGLREKTLVDHLVVKHPEIAAVGDDPKTRPGIVHRLDKEVSGCLLVAKTQPVFTHLKNQFQKREIKKEYLALVYGRIEADEGEMAFPLARGVKGKIAARPVGETEETREAITRFDVLKRYPQYTYLKVETLTGRTHQIRAHFKAYGHSVVGDRLYATRHQKIKEDLPQIFLHAAKIGFNDLNNQWREVSAPLPQALSQFLKTLPNQLPAKRS